MSNLVDIRALTFTTVIIRIILSILLGAMLGIERGLKNRPAGFRTYILVCLGSCIIMQTNQYVYQIYQTGDPVRMAAQVVSGIGFLGAGSIIVTKQNQIKGLTTAAGLWASSAVGLAVGIGLYEVAVTGGLSILIILRLLNHWDSFIRCKTKYINLYVELKYGEDLSKFIHFLKIHDICAENIQSENNGIAHGSAYIFSLRRNKTLSHDDIISLLDENEMINYFEEL